MKENLINIMRTKKYTGNVKIYETCMSEQSCYGNIKNPGET